MLLKLPWLSECQTNKFIYGLMTNAPTLMGAAWVAEPFLTYKPGSHGPPQSHALAPQSAYSAHSI
jgi:hypothetical protein